MAWPDDPLPAIRHEIHFGDRLLRCFAERPASLFAIFEQSLAANPDGLALIDRDERLTYAQLAARIEHALPPTSLGTASARAIGWRCCSATARRS